MNVSNVFYDGWECFNEVLPGCYWLIGHTGGHRRQEIGPIPPHQSYLGFSQTETKREVRSGVEDTHKRNH